MAAQAPNIEEWSETQPIRLAIVDDHELFREGFRAVLATRPGLHIVGEACRGDETYALVEREQPDVVVVDVVMEGGDGISVARELHRLHPKRRVLILSMLADPTSVARALAAGASGYALKEQPTSEIVEAIRAVAAGKGYLAPTIPRSTLDMARQLRSSLDRAGGPLDILSQRERQVFLLLAAGTANADIARQLHISVKTVETHRTHVLKKLGVHSLTELVRFAVRHGLITG